MKSTKKQTVKRILNFMRVNQINERDREIFNKILGDHQILSKLIFADDGMNYANMIYYNRIGIRKENNENFRIESYHQTNSSSDSKKLLNHMKNNCENIFIRLIHDDDTHIDIHMNSILKSALHDRFHLEDLERQWDYLD